jgi:DNA-binding LacI/PurR family transcriptional regulator
VAVPSLVNPYYAELAQVLVETAERAGLTVLVDCTGAERRRELRIIDGFSTHLVDGLILCPHAATPTDLRGRRANTPLVLLGERRFRSVDSVAVDSRAVGHAATAHLVGLGRRAVAAVGYDSPDMVPFRLRFEGFRQALEEAGLVYDPQRVVAVSPDAPLEQAGREAVDTLRERRRRVDAVFCYNDLLALGVVRALLSDGVAVPDEVAVMGVDDISTGRISTPTLSTIAPDTQAIADQAIGLLQARIAGEEGGRRHVVVGFELRARGSTLGARG